MKKKRKIKLTKRAKIIIIIALIVFAILAALVAALVTRGAEEAEFRDGITVSIKEVVEKNGCEYISDSQSSEEGFDIDIYLKFGRDPVTEDGISSEPYYNTVFSSIAYETGFMNIRLIDESREITVKITCSENGYVENILINDKSVEEYFRELLSEYAKMEPLEVTPISMTVSSQELNNLINSSWNPSNVNLGTKESTFEKYDIYFEEGIEIRNISKRVFNIVFTDKYQNEVISGIKVGADLEAIEDRFGEVHYESTGIVGYKTNDFYIFFSTDEISVYPNYNYTAGDYTELESIIAEYNESQDLNDFVDKLTDVWPDYTSYDYDTNFLEISYALKGMKISYSSTSTEGIQIYENYNGNLKNTQYDYDVVTYKVNQSLILENEESRLMKKGIIPDDSGESELQISNIFILEFSNVDDDRKNKLSVRCKTGEYPDNTLDDTIIINDYIWADDSHLIYNIQGQGIYMYNAITRETSTILEGEETYSIEDYDRTTKTLTYDDSQILINF